MRHPPHTLWAELSARRSSESWRFSWRLGVGFERAVRGQARRCCEAELLRLCIARRRTCCESALPCEAALLRGGAALLRGGEGALWALREP